jgi:hypothetical protein
VQACIQGDCALVAVIGGTPVSPSKQIPGDCQKLICDDTGNAVAMPDPSDVPVDMTQGCNTTSCNGATPVFIPTAPGTACTAKPNGVCNGLGVCGACKPGAAQCSNLTIQSCSPAGAWVDGKVCPNGCTNGVCTGACTVGTDAPYCTGIDQLNACQADHAWHASTCPYACYNGGCTGSCKPSGAVCNATNTAATWCDATGTPQSQQCPHTCLSGSCVDCTPNAVACCTVGGVAGKQTCGTDGHWLDCGSCGGSSYSCSGAGTCTCNPTNACRNTDPCGSRTDACGHVWDCGPNGDGTCADTNAYCYYNKTTNTYYCKVVVTTTVKTVTNTGLCHCDCCMGRYCCP